jgi:F0F1-type ATP synthase assembly protein I
MPDEPPAERPRPAAPGPVQLLQLGAVCGMMIGLGVLLGYLADRALGTSPLLVFLGLAIGILGAGVGSYQLIRPFVTDAQRGASKPKD